jgi:hypothetical protein
MGYTVHGQYLRAEGCRCWGQEPDGTESSGAPNNEQPAARQAARRGDVEQSKQLGKQPDEAVSSSRGDARAAKRARTGGAKIAL